MIGACAGEVGAECWGDCLNVARQRTKPNLRSKTATSEQPAKRANLATNPNEAQNNAPRIKWTGLGTGENRTDDSQAVDYVK